MQPRTLADFSGPSKESGNQVCFQRCPVCGSTGWKTYVNPQTGFWYCHAGQHGGGGRIDVDQPLVGRGMSLLAAASPMPTRVGWPEISLPAWEPLGRGALRYLKRRGITASNAAHLGMVEMADRLRVVIPYFGRSGEIIYWNSRSYSDLEEGPKYLAASGRHPLYVLPGWHPAPDLVLVEGVFDAIAVSQETGKAVAALGGKALPKYLEQDLFRLGTDCITVLLDGDALAAALHLRKVLMPRRRVRLVPLPVGQDPASMDPDNLREVLGCSKSV